MNPIHDAIIFNGLIFSILVIVVMLITRKKRHAIRTSFRAWWRSFIAALTPDEMNHIKGITILFVAIAVGGVIKASSNGPSWLYESFTQCAYIFGSVVAAVFMRSGYEAAVHKDGK